MSIPQLKKVLSKKTHLCIGLMSGTSMDGVDAALVRVNGAGTGTTLELLDGISHPYPNGLKNRLHSLMNADYIPLSEISQMNMLIGELFADAAITLMRKCGTEANEVDLIGSHGQTFWHNPIEEKLFGRQIRSTLQLGEPSVIQARTGIVTVADFRMKDVAFGGEGAPLIPYFDYILLRSNIENRAALNIGGIANITVLPAKGPLEDVFAFDTGPGNMLIDQLMMVLYKRESDFDGFYARKSEPNKLLLQKMMQHRHIKKQPPKSTGREVFGIRYVNKVQFWAERFKCKREEIISTVTEYTAWSIYKNYELFIKPEYPLNRIIVSGGGVHNTELFERVKFYFSPLKVESIENYGIPPDIKEAVAFALFAHETVLGNPIALQKVTGAEQSGLCGKIVV
ncbi:anhydro-N-acetylmuramic acid kinase [candidate division KSB1 bacterium]